MKNQHEDEVDWQVMENYTDWLNQLVLIDYYYVMLPSNDLVQLIQHMHVVDHIELPKLKYDFFF
jgi:hypothetical protein